jgi:hypothetical protein
MKKQTNRAFESKRRTRREIQALPFEDKLRILERLREDLIVGLADHRNKPEEPTREPRVQVSSPLLNVIEETIGHEPRYRSTQQSTEFEGVLQAEIEAAVANPERIAALVKSLFPTGVPLTVEFFERFNDLHMRLGWNETSKPLVGALLCAAMEQLDTDKSEALLAALPRVRNPGFFQTLDYLGFLLRKRELRPQFAADWFPSLVKRIGNDLASGDFWNALEGYCESHPQNAIELLRILASARDEEQISVAAYILGTLRSLNPSVQELLAPTELELSRAAIPGSREVYNRSWIQTARRGELEKTDLEALTSRISVCPPEEREQAFWIVCRCLLSPSISKDSFDFGMTWLRANVSSSVSPVAKYQIVDLAARLDARHSGAAGELILAVQPVLPEHKGIWQKVEHFLVQSLERNLAAFTDFLVKFARSNAANWLKVLKTPREFEWLLSEMHGRDVAGGVGQLVFDEMIQCRKLGLFFFDKLDLVAVPSEILDRLDGRALALAFYESQRTSLSGAANARFLCVLLPLIERMNDAVQRDLREELLLQLKNYPGACRSVFQAAANEFPILQNALRNVDDYFGKLQEVRVSGIAAMAVPGYKHAAKLNARRFSHAVEKAAEDNSVFLKMFKKTRLLYGKQWSTFHDGTFSETSGLQEFSSEVEIPRLEFIDPEGMNLRRFHASVKIRELSQFIDEEREHE